MFKFCTYKQFAFRSALSLVGFVSVLTFSHFGAAQEVPGTVRAASPVPASALGNAFARDDGTSTRLALFDALTSFSRDAKLEPALAVSWQSETPTTWVFKLREGVVFHNGTPFNADAVVATIDYLKQPEAVQYSIAREVATIASVRAVDALTVIMTTHRPDPILPKRLSNVSIVEPRAWRELGVEGFTQTPVGTGPFIVSDWGGASRIIVLEAFEDAWRKSHDVKRVEIIPLTDSTTRLQALFSDQVDIAVNLDPDNIPQLESGGFNVVILPAPHIVSLALRNVGNTAKSLQDKRVRQALNYAVNKRIMAEQVLYGHVRVPSQATTPEVYGYNPALSPYHYNPEHARALLRDAGYEDGLALTFGVFSGQTPADTLLFQLMQQDLLAVGVDVTLRLLPFPDLMRRIASGEWGGIDAYSTTLSSARIGDAIQPIEFMSCADPMPFFCDEEIMSVIEQSNAEMDPERRRVLLQRILAHYHDLAPALLLVDYSAITATSQSIRNYTARSNGVQFEKIVLKE